MARPLRIEYAGAIGANPNAMNTWAANGTGKVNLFGEGVMEEGIQSQHVRAIHQQREGLGYLLRREVKKEEQAKAAPRGRRQGLCGLPKLEL